MPLIGKKWKEEVLYTEAAPLGEDFLKKLELVKFEEVSVPKPKRTDAQ